MQESVDWAKKHSLGKFCAVDGKTMSWIPTGTFDAVISMAALYHLAVEDECPTLKEMVRVTKPGGNVFVGWMGAHNALPVEHWQGCGLLADAHVSVLSERLLYPAALQGLDENGLFGLTARGQYTVQGMNRSSYVIMVHKDRG